MTGCRLILAAAWLAGTPAGAATPKGMAVWDGGAGTKGTTVKAVGDESAGASATCQVVSGTGPRKEPVIRWTVAGVQWKGLQLDLPKPADLSRYTNVVLVVRGTVTDRTKAPDWDRVTVSLRGSSTAASASDSAGLGGEGQDLADGNWHEVVIPFRDLIRERPFDRKACGGIELGEWSGDPHAFTLEVARVGFDDRYVPVLVSLPVPRDPVRWTGSVNAVEVAVDLAAEGKPVSPYVYGISFNDPDMCAEMGVTIRRLGGNGVSPYDWRTGYSTAGADWWYENGQAGDGKQPHPQENDWVRTFREDRARGLESYLTLPCMGVVAKDATSCGFPKSVWPNQTAWSPDRDHQCGNGRLPRLDAAGKPMKDEKGEPLTEPIRIGDKIPVQNGKAVSATEQCELLRYCMTTAGIGPAKAGGIRIVCLDNEPMIWPGTHADLIGHGMTRQQYWDRIRTYAEILKAIDPDVKIAASAEWGWTSFFYSAAEEEAMHARVQAEGKTGWHPEYLEEFKKGGPLQAWWLKQEAAYEREYGKRLIDIFDLHQYEGSPKIENGSDGDPEIQELRIRDARKFWDESYRDPYTWMGSETNGNVAYAPLMRRWLKEAGLDLPLAAGEYGALHKDARPAAGIRQVETLAALALAEETYGLLWGDVAKNSPVYFAFKMFRNPDGRKTAVGDQMLPSVESSTDFDRASVYVYQDAAAKRLSLVFVNKKAKAGARVKLTLSKPLAAQQAVRYEYGPADARAIGLLPALKVGGKTITVDLPPMTVQRVDVRI